MLQRRHRISLSLSVAGWRDILETRGFVESPLSGDVAIESVNLPGELHQDPADRMMIATAWLNGWTLATRDERILEYGRGGNVDVLEL